MSWKKAIRITEAEPLWLRGKKPRTLRTLTSKTATQVDPIKKNTNCFSSEINPRGRSQGRKSLMASYLSDFSGEKPPARPRRQPSPMAPPVVHGSPERDSEGGPGLRPRGRAGSRRPETVLRLSRARAPRREKLGQPRGGTRDAPAAWGGSAPALSPAFPRAPTHRAGSLQRWRRQRQEPGIQNGGSGTKAPIPQAEEFCGRHLLVYLCLDAAVTR